MRLTACTSTTTSTPPHHRQRKHGRHRPTAAALAGTSQAELDFPDGPSWQALCDVGGQLACAPTGGATTSTASSSSSTRWSRRCARPRVSASAPSACRARQPPARHRRLQPVRQAVCRRRTLAARGLDGLPRPSSTGRAPKRPRAFEVLLQTWQGSSTRVAWPSTPASSPAASTLRCKAGSPDEIAGQIDSIRRRALAAGHIHFSLVAPAQNRKGVAELLRERHYSRT